MLARRFVFPGLLAGICLTGLQVPVSGAEGPTLAEPRVDRDKELTAPPLVLSAARQTTVDEQPRVDDPAGDSVMVAPGRDEIPNETVEHETQRPVDTEVIPPPVVVDEPSHVEYEPMCRELPVSRHIMHVGARRFAACHRGMFESKLQVSNPADCSDCCYLVCAKLPACCQGEPRVSGRPGILGRGIVEYCWSCGWTVKVVFRARGDVVVHYTAG